MKRVLLALVVLLAARQTSAATVQAASCSASDYMAALAQAAPGDTIDVPAGTCAWNQWATGNWTPNVTVQGHNTHITPGSGAGTSVFSLAAGRITGFAFDGCGYISAYDYAPIGQQVWRADHNTFSCATFNIGVFANNQNEKTADNRGLIDHNTFTNSRVMVYGFPGTTVSDLVGSTQWSRPLALGTNQAIVVEDNTFTFTVFGNVIDCQHGGRYVLRHNTITDSYPEAHSARPPARACRSWEIYENTFVTTTNAAGFFWPLLLRGGTGVVYNNTFTGNYADYYNGNGHNLGIDNVRSEPIDGAAIECPTSPWDGTGTNGYPCMDQIGRGGDAAPFAGSAPYFSQSSAPAYFWNNQWRLTANDAYQTMGVVAVNGYNNPSVLQSGRDYYANVGAKPGYTALAYPHPANTDTPPCQTITMNHVSVQVCQTAP